MDSIPLKRCSKCKRELPATAEFFRVARREKDGLKAACKECLKAQDAEWRAKNPGHATQWYYDNYEYATAQQREYGAAHKEEINARTIEWQKNNPEKFKAKQKRYNQSEKGKAAIKSSGKRRRSKLEFKVKRRIHRAVNKDKINARERERYSENPVVRLKQKAKAHKRRTANGSHTAEDVRKLYEQSGGLCMYCGTKVDINFHLDHIQPLSRGGSNNPDNLAVSCDFCNLSKGDKTFTEWVAVRGW